MSILLSTGTIPPPGTQEIGIVYGTSCLSRNFVEDLVGTTRNATIGGELRTYSDLMGEGVELALQRLEDKAEEAGADGVYGVRIATPQVTGGAAEIVAYGTAWRSILPGGQDEEA